MVRLLVTRAEPDAADSIARLGALGIAAVGVPLLQRAALHTSLPEAKGFAGMALTSANALRALDERGVLANYRSLPVFAVGDRTADAARRAGFADVTSSGGTLAHLVETIAAAQLAGSLFYPTSRHQSGDLARELAPSGIMVVTSRVYEMRAATALPESMLAEFAAGGFAGALFYSRRSAEIFAELTGGLDAATKTRLGALCLSEQVAAPLISAHFVRIGLADYPSEEAMMALALSFAREQNAS